jgi:processive 1,2-diacylglycerol beta-glucosyltransferase
MVRTHAPEGSRMHGPLPTGPLGRAMILTGSVGSGHTRAAHAVREAMLRCHDAGSVEVLDVLAFASAPFRFAYRDAYVSLIERAPGVVGWIYRSSDNTRGGAWRRFVQRQALARMRRRILDDAPDTIVCTHFLAAELVHGMVERGEWRGRFGVVVTDLDAHAMWAVCTTADRWFVALDETVEILAGKGVPRERIEVTGIPIVGAFAAPMSADAVLRQAHGFPAEGPIVLVSGGGVGVSMLDRTLSALLAMPIDGAVAIVCGKNESLRARAEQIASHARATGSPRMQCRVFGFTDRMHELMRVASLSVGKPGGLTTSEALASGLPMAIVHPVPGQEERNSDHLLEWGCAIRLNSPESLGWRVTALLQNDARIAAMRDAARARAKPFAADAIVRGLVERIVRLAPNTASDIAAENAEAAHADLPRLTAARVRATRAGTATTQPATR